MSVNLAFDVPFPKLVQEVLLLYFRPWIVPQIADLIWVLFQIEELTTAATHFPMSFADDISSSLLSSPLTVDSQDIQQYQRQQRQQRRHNQ